MNDNISGISGIKCPNSCVTFIIRTITRIQKTRFTIKKKIQNKPRLNPIRNNSQIHYSQIN